MTSSTQDPGPSDRSGQAAGGEQELPPDEAHVDTRAELLPEEQEAGSADPQAQARAILEESEERTDQPEDTRDSSTQTPGETS